MPKILIVDDIPANIKILGELLKGKYDILVAGNGSKAIKVAQMKLPDLILMDVIMPEMDGFTACKALKNFPETAEIPVIFITAKNETDDIVKGFEAGGVDYLTKPFNPAELDARVKTQIELKKSREKLKNYTQRLEELNQELSQRTTDLEYANNELRQAKNHLLQTSGDLKRLLDNAGQGFLYFNGDLHCGNQYSAECLRLFGAQDITGRNIVDLLFPADQAQHSIVTRALRNIFTKEPDMRGVYLSLLPVETTLHGRTIQLEYKVINIIPESTANIAMMVILTDITEQRVLEQKMEEEKNILRMVVAVVGNFRDLKGLLDDYHDFCHSVQAIVLRQIPVAQLLSELYVSIHTFKGNFSQMYMTRITARLHDLESTISGFKQISNLDQHQIYEFLPRQELENWPDEDLQVLKGVLGESFLDKSGTVEIEVKKLQEIEEHVQAVFPPGESRQLLSKLRQLRYRPFRELLHSYPDYVLKLAGRMRKSIDPVVIEDGEIPVDPDRYHHFVRSLVHVFRNSVDHGIESPEVRLGKGKDESGAIRCRAVLEGGYIVLTIADNGRGLELEKIKAQAVTAGICTPETVNCLTPQEVCQLILAEGLSTKAEVTELSGRGVGLKAVANEVEALQGKIEVETSPDEGTVFRFILPNRDAGEQE